MDIRELGYIGVAVADLDAWRTYAYLLGTMIVEADEAGFDIRIDERPLRVAVRTAHDAEGLAFAAWRVPDAAALEQAGAELADAGHPVRESTIEERAARRVRGMIHTTDPGGFRVELFWGPIIDHRPFTSAAAVSGFVTGDLGLGHIVLGTTNLDDSVDFYTGVLGFRVSDYWRPGADDVVFARCNPRHHSIALVGAPESALYHFMIEARTLDDVGSTLERHVSAGVPVSMGLGRHTNDRMVSFYSRSPSGFDVEFGCGGVRVDEASWTVTEVTKPSIWGHRRPGNG
ncbi:MAG: VOC family protein [Acidimicrobiales bacterium]